MQDSESVARLANLGPLPVRGFINHTEPGSCFTHAAPLILWRNGDTRARILELGVDNPNQRQAVLCQLMHDINNLDPDCGIDGTEFRDAFGLNRAGKLAGGYADGTYVNILEQACDEELSKLTTIGLISGKCVVEDHNSARLRPPLYTPLLPLAQLNYPGDAWNQFWNPTNPGPFRRCPVRGCANIIDSVPYVRREDLPKLLMLSPAVGGTQTSSHVPLEFVVPARNIIERRVFGEPKHESQEQRYFTAGLGLSNGDHTHAMTGLLHSDLANSEGLTVCRTRFDNDTRLEHLDARRLGPGNLSAASYIEEHVDCIWIFAE